MGISTQQLVQSPVMEIKHCLLCPHLPIHLKLEKLIHLQVQVNQTTHWGGKARISNQASGSDSFLYGGAQVIGATGDMGLAYGDQNFPGTPAHLPVTQLEGQHPGTVGFSATRIALPGHVAQQQLGFSNSEIT
ncbi:unnamed protein product [Musa acuminata var. zebrina]